MESRAIAVRSVHAHAAEIWHIAPCPTDTALATTVYNEGEPRPPLCTTRLHLDALCCFLRPHADQRRALLGYEFLRLAEWSVLWRVGSPCYPAGIGEEPLRTRRPRLCSSVLWMWVMLVMHSCLRYCLVRVRS